MIDKVLENVRRVCDFNLLAQQRLFHKWTGLWCLPPSYGEAGEPIAKAQKQWAGFVTDVVKKQRETLEPQVKAGLQIVEEACRIVEAKDVAELRAKAIEIWQKTFDCLRQLCEAELHGFEAACARWFELVTKAGVTQEVGKAAA
jgi:hypothetical protein